MNYGQTILFLDDDPDRRRKFLMKYPAAKCVKTAQECIEWLRKNEFVTLFLDFDLDGYVKGTDPDIPTCGMEVVRFLMNYYPTGLREIIIHSHNPLGTAAMVEGLHNSPWAVYAVPFGSGKLFKE